MSLTTLHLAKQNFKFSAAHFLIFDAQRAERLHGHNYQVKVDIQVPVGSPEMKDKGFFIDFGLFKSYIKDRLDAWDEHVLLPEKQAEMKFTTKGPSLEVRFRDRFYAFPVEEVILLPVTNTSVENLSRLLAEDFLREFRRWGVRRLRVSVEETRGQSASCLIQEPK